MLKWHILFKFFFLLFYMFGKVKIKKIEKKDSVAQLFEICADAS